MSETLPGNPHAWNLSRGYTTEAPADAATCQIEATLALAYEQRTTSIIAYSDMISDDAELHEMIRARLGLDGDES
jgi:hypothetical protein